MMTPLKNDDWPFAADNLTRGFMQHNIGVSFTYSTWAALFFVDLQAAAEALSPLVTDTCAALIQEYPDVDSADLCTKLAPELSRILTGELVAKSNYALRANVVPRDRHLRIWLYTSALDGRDESTYHLFPH